MACGSHSQGAFGKLLIEPGASPHTFDASSLAVEFLQESLSKHGRHAGNEGIRGTLQHESARIREVPGYVFGSILMYVSPNDFANLLGDVMGMDESPSGTFTTDDDLPCFGILIDRDNQTFEYKDCKLDSWILRSRGPQFGESGEPDMVFLQLNIVGSSEVMGTSWPGTPPSLGTAAADAPYVFSDSDSGVTLNSSTRAIEEFVFRVDHKIKVKYVNSLAVHSLRPRDRKIQARFRVPWESGNDDLYNQAVAGAGGSLVLTNGAFSTTLTLGKFQVPDNSPVIPGKDQVSLIVSGEVRGNGSTADLVIVNDNTP